MDMNTILNVILFGIAGWLLIRMLSPVKGLENLNADQLKEKLNGTAKDRVLIDVREPHEFKSGHIAGAKNLPLSQLSQKSGEVSKDKEVILYCRSGMRSKKAAKLLQKQGVKDLAHLAGGISSWNGKLKK